MNKKNICIIGVGQIGSRHLQALKAVKIPLEIWVIDNATNSLKTAKERYESMNTSGGEHVLHYQNHLPENSVFDVAIIATTSGPRADITSGFLKNNKVKYLILEKILFSKTKNYKEVEKVLAQHKVKTWVNCSMRIMPFYVDLKREFDGKKITYILYGNQSGMATDLIHHVDFVSFLTGSTNLKIDTRLLDKKLKDSKRKGYMEVTGSLSVFFENGSQIVVRCDDKGQSLKIIEVFDEEKRYIIDERQGKALISRTPDWKLEEIKFDLPYQSQLTTTLVEDLLSKGWCDLPTYKESAKLHLQTFEPIRKYFKLKHYPFT